MPRTKSRFGAKRLGARPFTPRAIPLDSPYYVLAGVPPALWDRDKIKWTYEVDFNPILGGQTLVRPIPIRAAAGFVLMGLNVFVTDTQNPPQFPSVTEIGNVLIQMTAVKSRYDLFSVPVPIDNVAGLREPTSPGIPMPIYFEPGEVINVQLTSLWLVGVATNIIARVSLHGMQLR